MERRSVGPGPYSRLLLAAMAVAGATAVAAVLLRNATSDSAPPAPVDNPGSDGSSVARTTVPPATAGSASGGTASTTGAVATSEPVASPFEADGVYRWLWVDPGEVRFVWRDDDDLPHGQLQAAREALENRGEQVVAITNGGIYRPGLIPSGLYVEDGVELTPLNRASGSGNFFLKPNGVFSIDDGRAAVETTEAYAAAARSVDGAVQSGPMLVIDSAINPAFSESSTSTHRRNAVGVDPDGRVLLIMADRAVTLWAMAERCLELGAVGALYLDGTLSRLEEAVDGRPIFPNLPVASMIAVVE